MFLSLTLLIVRIVNPTLFNIQFPPPFYVGIQSAGMIALGLLLTRHQKALSRTQQGIRAGNKFLLAMLCMVLAYGLIVLICNFSASTILLSPLYLIPAYLLISLAELLLSPIGLSAVTILASRKKVSTMMGIFFVSLGIGGFLSGKLASLTAIPSGELSIAELKINYASSFNQLFYILFATTLFCIILNFCIKYFMRSASK
jgi:POT family proton-dependent oligopeptide transporter